MSFRGRSNCLIIQKSIKDHEGFSWALKIIKSWAKKRGIYGYNFGYLNGISLIIMIAKIEKLMRLEKTEEVLNLEAALNSNFCKGQVPIELLRIGVDRKLDERVHELVSKFFEVYS